MSKLLRWRWPRLTAMPLALEIALVLAVKVAVIFALHRAFFSNPQAKKMVVPARQIEQHFFADTSADSNDARPRQDNHTRSPARTENRHGAD